LHSFPLLQTRPLARYSRLATSHLGKRYRN